MRKLVIIVPDRKPEPEECPSCRIETPAGSKSCPRCGRPLKIKCSNRHPVGREQMFCHICAEKLPWAVMCEKRQKEREEEEREREAYAEANGPLACIIAAGIRAARNKSESDRTPEPRRSAENHCVQAPIDAGRMTRYIITVVLVSILLFFAVTIIDKINSTYDSQIEATRQNKTAELLNYPTPEGSSHYYRDRRTGTPVVEGAPLPNYYHDYRTGAVVYTTLRMYGPLGEKVYPVLPDGIK